MRWTLGLLLLGLVVELGLSGDADADRKKIQGTWSMVEGTKKGEKIPPEVAAKIKFRITADEITIKEGNRDEQPAKYKLDPSTSPKHIDVFPPGEKQPFSGIYQLQGDELQLAINSPKKGGRPADFKESGPESFTIKLKREKP